MKLKIDVATLEPIPLRYYDGWTIYFNIKTESFECPWFSLFGFPNIKDLEKAMDCAIARRKRLWVRI